MNIYLQICGLVVVIFLFVLYRSHKTLGLIGERVFLRLLFMTILCISLDALSVLAIHLRDRGPLIITEIVCKAYLISMVWVGWANFTYVGLELSSSVEKYRRMNRILFLVTIAEDILIIATPISVFENGNEIYSFGPSVILTYIFTLFYIISVLNVAIYIFKKKNSRRGMAVIMTTSLWILCAVIQALFNQLLVVGFSMAVGIMILYVVLDNPDANLDRSLGCYNAYAYYNYLDACISSGKSFGILEVSVTDPRLLEDHRIDIPEASRDLIARFSAEKDVAIFKHLSTSLVMVSEKKEKIEEIAGSIAKIIRDLADASNAVMLFTVNDAQRFQTSGELLRFLTYIRNRSGSRLSSTVFISDDVITSYKKQLETEQEINQALKDDRVEVFLQPICEASSGRPVSAEALARIRNTDGSMLSPGLFIPVAESTGQITVIGERVLEKVCQFIKESEITSLGIQSVHVNLSVFQCDDSDAVARLVRIVEDSGISPSLINFEITETAVSTGRDTLIENMNVLLAKGFHFALDDFGKGESNLMYIVEMPVDLLKLDIDMTKAYFSKPKARPVVQAVTDMSRKLILPIVAEGIETKEEADGISAEGIEFIQGYYYSRPLPMPEFLEYVRSTSSGAAHASGVFGAAADNSDAARQKIHLSGAHLLLVEDNELSAEIVRDVLEETGFSVDLANDGSVAVEMISNSRPGTYDLILMDIRMPIMDGYEATKRIRSLKDPALSSIPIIALTAQDSEDARAAALEAGMNEYLPKPIQCDKLFALLDGLPEDFS